MRKQLLLSGIFLVLIGCSPADKNQKNTISYFDVKDYFEHEAVRLNKQNPLLTKTVEVNELKETKKIHITDWTKELSVYADADINRNAWKGLFQSKKTTQYDLYTSDNEKIPVKEVMLFKKNGHLNQIRILIKYSNVLYSSTDTLYYYPDSLYQIKKQQKIKLLSEKNYKITGKFK